MGLVKNGRVNNNIILNSNTAGPYQDTWISDSISIRNNYYQNVIMGPRLTLGSLFGRRDLDSLTHVGTTAQATAPYPHNLMPRTHVQIIGATPSNYNGDFVVSNVIGENIFEYEMASDPGSNASGPLEFDYRTYLGEIIIENNIIQVNNYKTDTHTVGFVAQATDNNLWPTTSPPNCMRSVIFRNNIASHLSGRQGEGFISIGVGVDSSDYFLCQNNVLSIMDAVPTNLTRERNINNNGIYLNNFNLSGQRITGRDVIASTDVLDI